jgi:serine/threonine protein kinase
MIGRGGNGTTWRAADTDGQTVAVKELPLRMGTPAKTIELFHREAAILQQLTHRGIPQYFEHFEGGEGRGRSLFVVMSFVDGPSLERRLRSHRFDEREVLELMAALLDILSYLHSLSPPVIHRDLKPANVILTADGPALIDFGSVRDALRDADLGGSTVAGTFGYMAPEQFHGDATPATDLYGLGALAVALLTRKAPHTIQDVQQRIQWRAHAQVSDGMADLLDGLLCPDAVDRPSSADDVAAAVAALLNPTTPAATPPPPPPDDGYDPPPPPLRRDDARPLVLPESHSRRRIALRSEAPGRPGPGSLSRIVTLIEHTLGMDGSVDILGESMRWSPRMVSGTHIRPLRVTLEPGAGGTRILISENLKPLIGGLYGGLLGGGLGGIGGGVGWMPFAFIGPGVGVAFLLFLTVFFVSLTVGLQRRITRTRTAQLQDLMVALQTELGAPPPQTESEVDEALVRKRRAAAAQKRQL